MILVGKVEEKACWAGADTQSALQTDSLKNFYESGDGGILSVTHFSTGYAHYRSLLLFVALSFPNKP
jgi:hypothetical protein